MDFLLFKHKETSRMTIDIDVDNCSILITQRWRIVDKCYYSSSSIEHFKRMVVSIVCSIWNQRCFVKFIDKNSFEKGSRERIFSVNFQLRWVSSNEHWKVYITPPGRSHVRWSSRKIYLDVMDIVPQEKLYAPDGLKQYSVAHEFGHTIGNSRGAVSTPLMGFSSRITAITHGDEYRVSDKEPNYQKNNYQRREFIEDVNSIMNVGNSLRNRHLDYIVQELNSMCFSPFACYFDIDEVIEI